MFTFEKLNSESVEVAVKIHTAAFPNFFLTSLGNHVLAVFYRVLINDKATIAWTALAEKKIIGFYVASTEPTGLYSRIFKKHFFSFLFPLLFAFVKRPLLLKRMLVSIISQQSHRTPEGCEAALLSICVDPSFSGKGVGSCMLSHLESEFREKGQQGYYLTTDSDHNEKTNQFYLKNQFFLNTTFQQGKRKMNLYSKFF